MPMNVVMIEEQRSNVQICDVEEERKLSGEDLEDKQ